MSSEFINRLPKSAINQARKKQYIKTSTIIIFAFFSAFYSRVLDSLGAPSPINFLHFAVVPAAFFIAITKTRIRNQEQIKAIFLLSTLTAIFLCCILISSILNNAGIINFILAFLLWVEPFLLLGSILCLPNQEEIIVRIRKYINYSFFFHTFLAFVQHYILNLQRLPGAEDNIQGVFYRSGAGHVVGASVALTFSIYFLVTSKQTKIQFRILFFLATFWHMILADAKQVLLSLIIGGVFLLLTKLKSIVETFKYIAAGTLLASVLIWCIQNLPAFRAFNTWIRPEIYGPEGEATLLKSASLRIIPTFYESFLNWLFGLGPGHTVDRLGGWMLGEYSSLLGPLGSTIHPASSAVWNAVISSWLGDQSSMFSPLFGWAGLWGDFGILGLMSYLAIGWVVYSRVCIDDISKFILFNVIAIGSIFSQMQEPGYMLTVAILLGLNWHEKKLESALHKPE